MKLQKNETILHETKPTGKLFIVWIFTRMILPVGVILLLFSPTLLSVNVDDEDVRSTSAVSSDAGSGLEASAEDIQIQERKERAMKKLRKRYAFIRTGFWLVVLLYPLYLFFERKTHKYFVTNRRCVFEGGILVRKLRSVPFHKITDVEASQNILERVLGISAINIFTPGTSSKGLFGSTKAELRFEGLQHADEITETIQEHLDSGQQQAAA